MHLLFLKVIIYFLNEIKVMSINHMYIFIYFHAWYGLVFPCFVSVFIYFHLFYYLYRQDTKRVIWILIEEKRSKWSKRSKKPTKGYTKYATLSYFVEAECCVGKSISDGLKLRPKAQETSRYSTNWRNLWFHSIWWGCSSPSCIGIRFKVHYLSI